MFLFRNYEIESFIHRLGFADDKKLEKFNNPYKYGFPDGISGFYSMLVTRAGIEIYDEYKMKHAPKKVR